MIEIQTMALMVHSNKFQGKVNGDLFDCLMPKAGALQTLADNLLKELKAVLTVRALYSLLRVSDVRYCIPGKAAMNR